MEEMNAERENCLLSQGNIREDNSAKYDAQCAGLISDIVRQ